MTPKYIFIHTAAYRGRNCDASTIDRWHRERGWRGIGYHYVILNDRHDSKADGTIEKGRDDNVAGAHARGINSQSLGICCIGNGDVDDFTPAQYESLYELLIQLTSRFQIPTKQVLGHRELNQLIQQGIVSDQYRTDKSCPGQKIDMDAIRAELAQRLNPTLTSAPPTPSNLHNNHALKEALIFLKQHQQDFPNARDELNHFLHHPEVMELLEA